MNVRLGGIRVYVGRNGRTESQGLNRRACHEERIRQTEPMFTGVGLFRLGRMGLWRVARRERQRVTCSYAEERHDDAPPFRMV